MAAATMLFFLGTKPWVLVVARALQGASAAFVWTAGTAYMTAKLGAEHTGAAMGWVSIGTAIGEVSGPVVGGFLYGQTGHWGLFVAALGVVILDIILRLCVKDSGEGGPEQPDADSDEDETSPLLKKDRGRNLPKTVDTDYLAPNPTGDSRSRSSSPGQSDASSVTLAASEEPSPKVQASILTIVRDRDLLGSLWANLMSAVMRTALETVSKRFFSLFRLSLFPR